MLKLKKIKINQFKGFLFVLPALFFYSIFVIIPIITTIKFSFFKWNGADPVMKFVGLKNYQKLLGDIIFWKALIHNIIWIAATIAIPVGIGLILAIFISSKGIKFKMFFRVSYFIPVVLALTIVSIIWNWIYEPTFGVLNTLLGNINLDFLKSSWLGDENKVLPSLIFAGSWTYYGFCMVIFLAAIQGVDPTYYEVAEIEGATPFQTTRLVTVPLLRNVITLLVLNSLIGSFKVFDIIYLMTKGGPYHSSEVIATYMYTNTFTMSDVGYGASISIALAIMVCLCSVIYMRFSEERSVEGA